MPTFVHDGLTLWYEERGGGTPVIFIDCDRIFNRLHGEQLVAGIPHAQGILIEHCGHAPMVEPPAEFARLVQQFLLVD